MQSECMLRFGSFHFVVDVVVVVVITDVFFRLCEYFIAYVPSFNSKLM